MGRYRQMNSLFNLKFLSLLEIGLLRRRVGDFLPNRKFFLFNNLDHSILKNYGTLNIIILFPILINIDFIRKNLKYITVYKKLNIF